MPSEIASSRNKVIEKLKKNDKIKSYATQIEEGIYNHSLKYSNENLVPLDLLYDNFADETIAMINNNIDVIIKMIEKNTILPKDIINIKPEEIDKRLKSKIEEKNKLEQYKNEQKGSDLYTCPRCKQSNVSITQKQIRRADEPPSVIIRCLNCHYSWRID
jgi:DNA-directed RNA polymerase subunit M/transcription elongation factor TFIIS